MLIRRGHRWFLTTHLHVLLDVRGIEAILTVIEALLTGCPPMTLSFLLMHVVHSRVCLMEGLLLLTSVCLELPRCFLNNWFSA